jgi:signal transduction histidine kinase
MMDRPMPAIDLGRPAPRRSRILAVDDDERNLLAVAEVLESVGEVVCAKSGEEALRHLLRDEYAVILLDVLMPGMDGYETAGMIRRREQSKRTPIIFLSAINKEDQHMLRGYDAGAVDYVFKPFDTVILRSKVSVFVDLYEKTKEIEETAQREQGLLQENLRVQAEKLEAELALRQSEEHLAQARKMETIGQLTGGIAHDFNNLLASVLSGVSLLERQGELPGRSPRILEMMRHAAEQGAVLVERMLAFSRRQKLQAVTVPVPELVESLEGMLAPVLGGRVRLHWKIDRDAGAVLADRGQLELALMNLVINARDAMPAGGAITVSAGAAQGEGSGLPLADGDYVVFAVEDTGMGIPPELLAKVVEPFFTTKEVGKGTGLGLSTAYGFAQQSGGALDIRSEVGRGTRVALWLPRASGAPLAAVPAKQHAPRAARAAEGRPAAELLLVDDSGSLREFTAAMLRDKGFKVTTAAGGAEALARIERDPDRFDVIITDFAMPLLSGLDVIRFARALRAGWPAIIISGYADATPIKDRPEDVRLLGKPFSDESLLVAIEGCLAAAPEQRGIQS